MLLSWVILHTCAKLLSTSTTCLTKVESEIFVVYSEEMPINNTFKLFKKKKISLSSIVFVHSEYLSSTMSR